jgi:eukaryotic-like serine/threonine-protein kinase
VLGEISGGRYALLGLLGAGGMAEVFLARDRILGRDLALKVLREDYAEDAGFVSRFRREAQSAASLNNPHVVQVYDQGRSEDGRLYIAMEHVPGGSLKDLITKRGALEPAEAALLASQVAEALGVAHERGIVHRDVKPQNVLLGEAGEAKVADFGIALAASASTTSGTDLLFGTPSYMSPEQAMGERVGPASDLYSLGIVLYEMLTGTVPFAAEGALATAMKHVTDRPVSPRERDPSVPEAMEALVMGLLAKDPEDRCRSAFELAEDLRRARAGLPLAFVVGPARHPETPREFAGTEGGDHLDSSESAPRRRPVAIGLVALAALLALLGAFGWNLTGPPEGAKAVGTVTTTQGAREGGAPAAPEGSRERGSGKGVGSGVPSVDRPGGAYVHASSSVSASASASASASPASTSASASASPEPPTSGTVASGPWASKPRASGTWGAAPSTSSPAPGGSSGTGGQDAGTTGTGAVESAAQGQYR